MVLFEKFEKNSVNKIEVEKNHSSEFLEIKAILTQDLWSNDFRNIDGE